MLAIIETRDGRKLIADIGIITAKSGYFSTLVSKKLTYDISDENAPPTLRINENARYLEKIFQYLYDDEECLNFEAVTHARYCLMLAHDYGLPEYESSCTNYLIENNAPEVVNSQLIAKLRDTHIPSFDDLSDSFFKRMIKAKFPAAVDKAVDNILEYYELNFHFYCQECPMEYWLEIIPWKDISKDTYKKIAMHENVAFRSMVRITAGFLEQTEKEVTNDVIRLHVEKKQLWQYLTEAQTQEYDKLVDEDEQENQKQQLDNQNMVEGQQENAEENLHLNKNDDEEEEDSLDLIDSDDDDDDQDGDYDSDFESGYETDAEEDMDEN